MAVTPGSRLGPYEIVAPLGAGGMGEVFRARDGRLGRDVAIKILPERLANNAHALARFEQEARAVAALSHPNILAIHDFGREGEVVFAVMELLEGESLDRRLSRENLPWKKVLELGAALADGLASAHARGIVHRDLKPANIFITRDGVVKILDFGLARLEAPDTGAETATPTVADLPQTEPGTVMGTVGYMSPEQVRGEPADARSDLFSLGCVLYEMLTGRRAFRQKTGAETLAAILRDHPAELPESGRTIPAGINGVVKRCLEKFADERFQSARDLAFALREILAGSAAVPISDPSADAAPPRHYRAARIAGGFFIVLVASLMVLDVAGLRSRLFRLGHQRIQSLAVLPFANLSGDPQQEYFADGITEQIMGNLARVGNLRVISRTSAMSYKRTRKRLPEIASELDVDAVVEGSVARVGDTIKVSAQLIQASTDKSLWAESYERDVRDVLAIQGEITRSIARKIEIALTPQEQTRLEGAKRIDPDAYDAYVRGRYYYNKRDLGTAVKHFQQALDIDPTNAAVYAGLADSYSQIAYLNDLDPRDAFPKAKAAAQKALELDSSLAAPHASLGFIHMYFDWDFPAAEAEFKKAIALDSNYASAHHFYSVYLSAMLRPEEARRQIEAAHRLDPLSVLVSTDMGFELYYDRKYDASIKTLRDAIEMNPKAPRSHFWLGRTYQAQGKYKEAIAEYEVSGDVDALGHLYGILGRRDEAKRIIADRLREAANKYVSPYDFAIIYLGMGDVEQTLAWLDRCVEGRVNWLVWLLKDPRWDPMRSNDRFQDIIRKVGFPADARSRQPGG